MSQLLVIIATLSGLLSISSAMMMGSSHMAHHQMTKDIKTQAHVNPQSPKLKREENPLDQFCSQFEKLSDFVQIDSRSLNDLRSGCSGQCVRCKSCSESCSRKVSRGCKGLLNERITNLKIHSPLQASCRSYISIGSD